MFSNIKKSLVTFGLAAFALLGITPAFAVYTLPAGVGTGLTDVTSALQATFDLALPVVILGVTLVLVIKFLKKFANKI